MVGCCVVAAGSEASWNVAVLVLRLSQCSHLPECVLRLLPCHETMTDAVGSEHDRSSDKNIPDLLISASHSLHDNIGFFC
jgi:hypothetical protein